MNDTDTTGLIDTLGDAGFDNAEFNDGQPAWIRETALAYRQDGDLFVIVNTEDTDLIVTVTNANGLLYTAAVFGIDPIGLRMFGAAMRHSVNTRPADD
jgi:hypothetical protein